MMSNNHKPKATIRIQSIEVMNFKSLFNFNMRTSKFSCLIGLNGVGKSTVLQFVDFMSELVRGDMTGWLERRQWKAGDLRSRLTPKRHIEFCIRFEDQAAEPAGRWEAHYSPSENRCTWERLDLLDFVLETTKNECRITNVVRHNKLKDKSWKSDISFNYQGSIVSSLKEDVLPPSMLRWKRFFQEIESLDMLTPESLRQRTRNAGGTLGLGGRNLSAFVYELGLIGQKALVEKLKEAYPQLTRVDARSLRSGWKQLQVTEVFQDGKLSTEARHLNDGMLRLIAILSELSSEHGFVLFDEIENGINPELVEFVIDLLVNASQQVMVTTHSPMILNYLDDETARDGVIYLYKTPQGYTKAVPFFSIPSLKKKLAVMGPGEAFVDTNLTKLAEEIAEMPQRQEEA
jgi:predicted ATPase